MDDKAHKELVKRTRKETPFVLFKTHPVFLEKMEGNMRALAIFHYYKAYYLNSTIYNFSYDKVAKDLGISWKSAKKYIDFLISKNFAYRHGKNLTFVKVTTVGKDFKVNPKLYRRIKIKRGFSLTDIENILYAISLNNYCIRQNYAIGIKRDRQLIDEGKTSLPFPRVKKIMREKEKCNFRGKRYDHVVVTCRNLAKKWHMSPSKVSLLLRRLADEKLISKKNLIEVVDKNFKGIVFEDIKIGLGYAYSYNNKLYLHRGTVVSSFSPSLSCSLSSYLSSVLEGGSRVAQIDCAKMLEL